MDFQLSKEHEMARSLFKDFAEKEVKPLAIEVDDTHEFPRETVSKMQKLGFMGIPIPKEYGGQGCDPLTYVMCVEELAKVCGTTSVIVSAHTSLCCDPIMTFGTEEQKQKYLIPLAQGKLLGAFGLTEPGAGTDAQGVQTKAVLSEDGKEWILNGSKCFITNGKEADIYIIIAYTDIVEDKRGRKQKKFSAFIVEKNTPGSRSPCTLWTAAVSESLHRHSDLLRALLTAPSLMSRRESSSEDPSHSSRIHSSSLPIWLLRLRLQSFSYIRLLMRRRTKTATP